LLLPLCFAVCFFCSSDAGFDCNLWELRVPGIWDMGVGGQSSAFYPFLVIAVIADGAWQFDELYPGILRC